MDRRGPAGARSRTAASWVLALAMGCAGTVETDISLELPEADRDAQRRLSRLELELWPPAENACRDLVAWRADTCPRTGFAASCPAAPSPRDGGRTPTATRALARDADGVWGALRMPALDQGPWDLRVRGLDASGATIVYGCLTLASGAPRTVALWRPWCDVQACSGTVLPACLPLASVRCPAIGSTELPTCTITSTATVLSWEERGVPCPPDGVRIEPCHPASVSCTPDAQTVLVDGVCPRDPTCSDARQACSPNVEPLSCDMRCEPNAPCRGAGRVCAGKVQCVDRQSSVCVYPTETCNDIDEDCDGVRDAMDPDALAWCNVGRGDYPSADACARLGCQCGSGPPCEGREVCRRGSCAPVVPPMATDAGPALDARPYPDANVDASPDALGQPDARDPPDARDALDAAAPDAPPDDVPGRPDAGLVRDSGLTRD